MESRWPRAVCLAAALLLPALARAAVSGVLVGWGEVEADYAGPMEPDAQLKALSPGQTVRNPRFVRYTDEVQARMCLRFGIAAWLTRGPGEHLPDRVEVVVTHPLLTRPDGASSNEDSFYTPVIHGEVGAYFVFERPWELQPGAWTFELRDGSTVLLSKSFTVRPATEQQKARECGDAVTS